MVSVRVFRSSLLFSSTASVSLCRVKLVRARAVRLLSRSPLPKILILLSEIQNAFLSLIPVASLLKSALLLLLPSFENEMGRGDN